MRQLTARLIVACLFLAWVALSTPAQASEKKASGADARLTRVEEQAKQTSETVAKQPGSITFGGDLRTELIFDADIQHEGLNESYSRDFQKAGALKNLTFVAWQLPFLERNSAFVRNANGTQNVVESRRAGRDLALYGAQLRARLKPSGATALAFGVADFYFSGTQFITPAQVFGNQLQLPVAIMIPATATTPAQTVTGVATIPRDLLVAGNANLGLSAASNNATNRDGRLASGFNLVNLIGLLDLTRSKSYAADPRVVLAVTGLFSRRANGLLGPFGATPPGSLNRPTARLQFDTVFRF